MNGDFSEKLKTVLSDPDAMATIAGLAKNFAREEKREEKREERPPEVPPAPPQSPASGFGELMRQPAIAEALRVLGDGSRERLNLLRAMRPFVKEEKKEKLDRIIQTMQTLDLLVSAQKLL